MSAGNKALAAIVVLAWNRAIRVGTAVEVRCDNGILFSTRTSTGAWLLGDGTPVVGLEGMRGGFALERVVMVDGRLAGRCVMGWSSDNAPGHEGWVVGLVRDELRGLARNQYWRELAASRVGIDGAVLVAGDDGEHEVRRIQVGCDCGWRSRAIVAPYGTKWHPSYVAFARPGDEDLAGDIWSAHAEEARLAVLLGGDADRTPMLPDAVRTAKRLRDVLAFTARTLGRDLNALYRAIESALTDRRTR